MHISNCITQMQGRVANKLQKSKRKETVITPWSANNDDPSHRVDEKSTYLVSHAFRIMKRGGFSTW